jgi:chromosomal replication initiation ATPase DnaA
VTQDAEVQKAHLRAFARISPEHFHMTRANWRGPWPAGIDEWCAGQGAQYLTILGGTGVGKTHLAVAILRGYLDGAPWEKRRVAWSSDDPATRRRSNANFFHAIELQEEARKFERPVYELAHGSTLSIVDDAAWDRNSHDLQYGALGALIHRSGISGRSLVITTNLPEREFQQLDPRIVSRLSGGLVIVLGGKDHRVVVAR